MVKIENSKTIILDSLQIIRNLQWVILLIVGGSLGTATAQGSLQKDTVFTYVGGQSVIAMKVLDGGIPLYECTIVEEQIEAANPFAVAIEQVKVKRFFVGVAEGLVSITPKNYNKVIKQHLPDAPELHQKLGRRGFRYENIPQMIEFYNRFRWKNSLEGD